MHRLDSSNSGSTRPAFASLARTILIVIIVIPIIALLLIAGVALIAVVLGLVVMFSLVRVARRLFQPRSATTRHQQHADDQVTHAHSRPVDAGGEGRENVRVIRRE